MPRIAPLPESEWGDELRPILQARPPGLSGRLGDNNIFSTFACHKDLLRAWLPFGGFLLGRGVLPARERELLILRTAYNCRSAYEWGQHVRISEGLDMNRDEILRVAEGPAAVGWQATDAAPRCAVVSMVVGMVVALLTSRVQALTAWVCSDQLRHRPLV